MTTAAAQKSPKTTGGHTAGPWEYSGGGIWGKSPWNARVRLADITFHNSINGIASEANGRLMAAAPDLFDALTAIVEYEANPDFTLWAKRIDAARAAIAKAVQS